MLFEDMVLIVRLFRDGLSRVLQINVRKDLSKIFQGSLYYVRILLVLFIRLLYGIQNL